MKRTALVTGAASGIGCQLAAILAAEDFNLVLVDIQSQALIAAAQELSGKYPQLHIETLVQDLAQTDAAYQIFRFTESRQLSIDILINNAGIGSYGKFSESDWNRESQVIGIHVHTLTALTKYYLPGMVQRGWGKVMNVSSMVAFWPTPFNAVYAASKTYILHFSQAIANELEGTGVTVTVLCPGLTKTNFIHMTNTENQALYDNPFLTATAGEVAQYAYQAMMKGIPIAIPRWINRLTAFLSRAVPRKTLLKWVRKGQKANRKSIR